MHHLVGVIHSRFGIGKRSLQHPRVRKYPEALVNETLVPQRLERPHDALHVRKIERLVVVVEIDPPRLTRDIATPVVGVLQHRRATVIVEFLDSKVGDCLASRNAQLPLGFRLGRQTVTVPTKTPFHSLAAHGAVSRHCVLDEARQEMSVVRQAVGKRRTVVKYELRISGGRLMLAVRHADSRMLLHRGDERVVRFPERKDACFDLGKIRLRSNLRIRASHQSALLTSPQKPAFAARSRVRTPPRWARCRAVRCWE